MTRHAVFAVPGDLDTPTGGYAYDKRIIAELRALGWTITVLDLGEGFPCPGASGLQYATEQLEQLDPQYPVVVDGLALGVLPDAARALRERHRLIALVHHPLALENGISPGDAERFRLSERDALAQARHVIVTSPATARILAADFAVPEAQITIARPGVDPVAPARGSDGECVVLLAVGSLVPRKGYDLLIAALVRLPGLQWHLTIAGDASRDPQTAAALRRQIADASLAERVTLAGSMPEQRLAELYDRSDAFVLPSRFEGYGMAYAQAIAFGLPVIATKAGAIPDTVPPQASLMVPSDDVDALEAALRQMISDTMLRKRLAAAARKAAAMLPAWRDSATIVARVIEMAA